MSSGKPTIIDKTSIRIDDAPGPYYVTVEDGGRFLPLLGPYEWHLQALCNVDRVRRAVMATGDPKAPWYGYGTSRYPDGTGPGLWNERLGLVVAGEQ